MWESRKLLSWLNFSNFCGLMGIGVGKPLWVSLNHFGCSTEGYVLFWRTAKLQACLDYLDWSMEKQVCLNLLQTVILRKRSNLQVCLSHLDWPMGGEVSLNSTLSPWNQGNSRWANANRKSVCRQICQWGSLTKLFLTSGLVRATWIGGFRRYALFVYNKRKRGGDPEYWRMFVGTM